jgi:hypothetical protein
MMTDSVIKHASKEPYTSDRKETDPAVAQNVWTDGDRFLKGTVQNFQQYTDKKGGVLNTKERILLPVTTTGQRVNGLFLSKPRTSLL